jgi:2-oxoglutarate ferredoxin oxidoreductase subunit gamma
MNSDSLPLCEGIVKQGGLLLVNSTLVKEEPKRADLRIVKIEASGIAEHIGNIRFANMVALGAMAKLTGALALDEVEEILKKFFPSDTHRFIPLNVQAIHSGAAAV